jgi:disulfide bond formation protein DsbB
MEAARIAGRIMKLTVTALVLALAGTAGSLFLSLGLGLKACPLCFYQRTFIMAAAAVLLVGLTVDRTRPGLFCLLSLPLALAGLGVAAFHEYLVVAEVLECPQAIFGLGTAPAQSLAVFAPLTLSALAGAWSGERKGAFGLALVVGVLMAWASIASSPPLPPVPKTPYDPVKQPLDMCRPVFRGE